MIVDNMNNPTLCGSNFKANKAIATTTNDCIIPTNDNTEILLKNQDDPLVGLIADCTNGNTIDISNAPTNNPKDKKYGVNPVP